MGKLRVFTFSVFGAIGFCIGTHPVLASFTARDALIIVGKMAKTSSVSQQVNARMAISETVLSLRPLYRSLDLVVRPEPTEADVARAILKHKGADHVDVLVLSAPLVRSSLIRGLRFSNLRLVYESGSPSQDPAIQDWIGHGAKLSIGQKDFTATSTLSATRFIRRWSEGWKGADAATDAQEFSEMIGSTLGDYVRAESIASLAIAGIDVDREGGEYSWISSRVSNTDASARERGSRRTSLSYKTPFQAAALAATSALLPSVEVNQQSVPTVQAFLDRIKPLAWDHLQNLFSTGISQSPAVDTSPLASEIWIDGRYLKYIADPITHWAGGKLYLALDLLQGIKITRSDDALKLSIYFKDSFDISIKDESSAARFQLYSIHVPQTVRAEITNDHGTVTLSGLDFPQGEDRDQMFVKLKLPVVSDQVYLRRASVELATGKLTAEAGILGDAVGLIATGQIFAAHPKASIDLWQSIEDNSSLFEWPVLAFH